jgi:exopolysaccharide production protein ExoQ
MSPTVAVLLCLVFIACLFCKDYRRREKVSLALWIPLLWLFILGSRPISMWFGIGPSNFSSEALVDGSPADRLFFLSLIAAGFVVLARRRVAWSTVLRNNRWLFVFFLYLGLSVLWSEYSFVSFKRWIKDIGNIIMVLIVFSEQGPIRAAKIVLRRCCYLLIPLSVVVIKYFPELSRSYDRWSGQVFYSGLTSDKNLLGMTLCACGISLCWLWFEIRETGRAKRIWVDQGALFILGVMEVWLLWKANSATAIACTLLAGGCILAMQFSALRRRLKRVGSISVAMLAVVLLLVLTSDLRVSIVRMLGRDMTLTGRTAIWDAVLREDTNFFFGEGYYSFWLGDRTERLSAQYHYELNESHNGYLETYLNGGSIGLFLFVGVLLSAGRRIMREATLGMQFAMFRLACLVSVSTYGVSEAIFNRMSILWFLLLLVVVECPPRRDIGSASCRERPGEK